MRLIKILITISLFASAAIAQYSRVIDKGGKLYLANTVVLKLKGSERQSNILQKTSFPEILKKEGILSSAYVFEKPVGNPRLDNIILVNYGSNKDPEQVSADLRNSSEVEWCEPKFVYNTEFIPSDSSYSNQYALTKIKAAEAWDITKGDSSIVIAIIDTGVDWDHPDLSANIWRNWDEIPVNGTDDDGNGFSDDIRGWDFGGLTGAADNDPMEDKPDHGTHVAGIAAAVTNNQKGIASIGFNSRIMVVKTSRNDVRATNGTALISYGYEGIVYAADNGAKVINLSWGGYGYSIFGQEAITYAVSKGALVVAAAGNENVKDLFYPCSYTGVLSVASTGADDKKSSFSNYGANVDVTAPGSSILSTWQNNIYALASGTSMASPLTAGLAGLVWQQFPSFTPLQIAEQIRINSDDVYSANPFYRNQLGKGRINALNAVSNKSSVSVRATDFNITDVLGDNDGNLEPGETITLHVDFTNYLNTVENLVVTAEALDNYSTVVNGNFNGGTHGMLEQFDNSGSEFTLTLAAGVPPNTEITIKLNLSSGSYQDFQLIKAIVNPSYANQTNGKLQLTIGSDGTLGFIDSPGNLQGNGFLYDGSDNLLFEGALMIGTSAAKISDAARESNSRSFDFVTIKPFTLKIPGDVADQEGLTEFNDDGAGSSRIGISVILNSYTFSNEPEDDFIILKYRITNNGQAAITGLYAGIFFDWDFIDAIKDVTAYDETGKFGHVHRVENDLDIWVAAASGDINKGGFYAIRNDGSQGNINLFDSDIFSDLEKWMTISGGVGVQTTGPGDISHVVNNGPYDIALGQSVDVPFIIGAGRSIEDLRTVINSARNKYSSLSDAKEDGNEIPEVYDLLQNYPNPFNPSTKIEFSIARQENVVLKVFNMLGEESAVLMNKNLSAGKYVVSFNPSEYKLSSGVYFYEIKAGDYHAVRKMIYLK